MNRLAVVLFGGALLLAARLCFAEQICGAITLPASVEAGGDELTLADLLPPDACPQMYRKAARISLGSAPPLGGVRVLDGGPIGRLIAGLEDLPAAARKTNLFRANKNTSSKEKIPERIVVRRAGGVKSCAEIERFLAGNFAAGVFARGGAGPKELRQQGQREEPEEWNCAGAHAVPAHAEIELAKTTWNPGLKRWDFALRCVHTEDCVPFLVWARGADIYPEPQTEPQVRANATRRLRTGQVAGRAPAVERGQTAMLTWEQGGIRVVLPVTCLEAGAAGQFVLVRFQNAPRTLRAEVVGPGVVRVSL
jgi:hypothetical protein